jgi:hypothetical protein
MTSRGCIGGWRDTIARAIATLEKAAIGILVDPSNSRVAREYAHAPWRVLE